MKVLQIAVGVTASNVYYKLFSEFKKQNLPFEVYVPLHDNKNVKDINTSNFPFSFYSNRIIKPHDKFLYFTKIRRMVNDIKQNFNLEEFTLIHAHSLFSDGGVAYELYKKYNIPYIVAIRNTDVNKYFKYGIHLRKYALEIMLNAKKVIFISPSYQKFVINRYVPRKYMDNILPKIKIIPNGVDDYWLKQRNIKKEPNKSLLKLIFLGRIDKNKNLKTVIEVVNQLKKRGINCRLDVIGDGPLRETLEKECSGNSSIVFHGPIYQKDKIREKFLSSDILVVPSFTETFGLVYLEAMSCGVPVLYTRNQGFDGFFMDGTVGYAVNPNDPEDIINSIYKIIENYKDISSKCYEYVKPFNWYEISNKYRGIYSHICH